MSESIHLTLPFPPSVNAYWRTIMVSGRKRTILSKRAREYKTAVLALVSSQKPLLTGRLAIEITLSNSTKRKYDCDNMVKAIFDSLQDAGVFADDEQIDLLLVRKAPSGEGTAKIVIEEIP